MGSEILGFLKAPYTVPVPVITEMAAALFESLLMNHAFVDGNKRVAFFATDIFLRLNGWKLRVEPKAAHEFLIGLLERNECDFAHLLPWIRGAIVRVPVRR